MELFICVKPRYIRSLRFYTTHPVLEPRKGLMELAELIRCWSMKLNRPDGREE
jgi:hypothetical protein